MNPLTLGDIDSQLVKEKAKKISETIKSPLIKIGRASCRERV